mgnify:FL=1
MRSPESVLWSQASWPQRLAWWNELRSARHPYRFSFRYFGRWDLLKLHRYIHRQLPLAPAELCLTRACYDEYETLKDMLAAIHIPSVVMDFGCGTGRSSIFFKHRLGWEQTKFLLVDGQQAVYGDKSNMTQLQGGFTANGHDLSQSFYTDFDLLDRFLLSNGMSHYDLVDLTKDASRLKVIRGVDLFYSFHCVGWHYDPATVFETYQLWDVVRPGGLVILGIRTPAENGHPLPLEPFWVHGYRLLTRLAGKRKQDFLVLQRG